MSHLTGQNIVTWQQPAAWKAEKCRQDSEWPYVQFYYYLKKKKKKEKELLGHSQQPLLQKQGGLIDLVQLTIFN